MSKLTTIWVYSDTPTRTPELIAGALQLADTANVFILGTTADITQAYASGATNVYHLGEANPAQLPENYAPTMAQAITQGDKPTLVLLSATKRGKALAAKLGATLNAGIVNDATSIQIQDGAIQAQHMVYGGLAFGQETITTPVAIATLGTGLYEPLAPSTATGTPITLEFIAPKTPAIQCKARRAKQAASVDLGKAKRVIGIGRGIAKQEDIAQVETLCQAIGAELGCSRPIAEGEKWMERERYIGVSGVMLKPDLYIALGISGQIQHMVGVNTATTIIAVNKDKNAPIFQYADYGLVGDIYKVIPALISALKS